MLGPAPDPPEPEVPPTIDAVISELDKHVARLNGRASKHDRRRRGRGRSPSATRTADAAWIVAHAVHDGTHHLRDVGRGLHASVPARRRSTATVAQINTSGGGVPKRPQPNAVVDRRGVVGDTQAERKHHGRPMQALSLWSAEVIDALRGRRTLGVCRRRGRERHGVGHRLDDHPAGRAHPRSARSLAEISAFATPCAKNAQWFSDRDFRRIDHNRHPGWSRAYAWVLEGGEVETGDAVVVEP